MCLSTGYLVAPRLRDWDLVGRRGQKFQSLGGCKHIAYYISHNVHIYCTVAENIASQLFYLLWCIGSDVQQNRLTTFLNSWQLQDCVSSRGPPQGIARVFVNAITFYIHVCNLHWGAEYKRTMAGRFIPIYRRSPVMRVDHPKTRDLITVRSYTGSTHDNT